MTNSPRGRRRTNRSSDAPVLFVAAWEPELGALRDRLSAPAAGPAPVFATVGVGLVEAAVGASRAIAAHRPGAIVLVGTAGAYPDSRRTPLGSAAVARRLQLVSSAVARGEAYLPRVLPARTDASPELAARLGAAGAPLVDVACPVGITRTAAAARRLGGHAKAALETLEAFAVARAAAAAEVPFAAVLGVSNQVGPRAHAEWKRYAALASEAAAEVVARWWRSGA